MGWVEDMGNGMFNFLNRYGMPDDIASASNRVRLCKSGNCESFRTPSGVGSSQASRDLQAAGVGSLNGLYQLARSKLTNGTPFPWENNIGGNMATGVCNNLNSNETQSLLNTLQPLGWEGAVNDLQNGVPFCQMIRGWSTGDIQALINTLQPMGWSGLIESAQAVLSEKASGNNFSLPVDEPAPDNAGSPASFGSIENLSHALVAGDEIDVTAVIRNPTGESRKYRIILQRADGSNIDTESRTIPANSFTSVPLTTRFKLTDVGSLGGGYRVTLQFDDLQVDSKFVVLSSGEVKETEDVVADPVGTLYGNPADPDFNQGNLTPINVNGDSGGFSLGSFGAGAGSTALLVGVGVVAFILLTRK